MNPHKSLNITLIGRDFCINCPEHEQKNLKLAAGHLEKKIQEVKAEGKVVDSDRIVLIAALGIAHELLMLRDETGFDIDEFKRTIKSLDEEVGAAINIKVE